MDRALLFDAQSTIALYTQSAVVRRCRYHLATSTVLPGAVSPSAVNNRSTPVVVISRSVTLDVPWPNFLSPKFGRKSQREYPYFGDILMSIKVV